MIIKDILDIDRGIAPILLQSGMPCLGCPSARAETLGQAGMVHGMDDSQIDSLINSINEYLESVQS
jgi:hybrid cluster-associated redox disulfide protein